MWRGEVCLNCWMCHFRLWSAKKGAPSTFLGARLQHPCNYKASSPLYIQGVPCPANLLERAYGDGGMEKRWARHGRGRQYSALHVVGGEWLLKRSLCFGLLLSVMAQQSTLLQERNNQVPPPRVNGKDSPPKLWPPGIKTLLISELCHFVEVSPGPRSE